MREYPWTLEFDKKYQTNYWFNTQTGESEWAVDNFSNIVEDENSFNQFMNENENQGDDDHDIENRNLIDRSRVQFKNNTNIEKEIELAKLAFGITDKTNKSSTTSNNNQNRNHNHNRHEDIIIEEPVKSPNTATETPIEYESRDIIRFYCCNVIHVLFIESILLVIESILRSVFFFILACGSYISFLICRTQLYRFTSYQYIREGCICAASSLSFLCPLLILFIYRDLCNCKIDFNIHSLPSLVGWIDSRRFAVICFGSGSHANNINDLFEDDESSLSLVESQDSWTGIVIFPPAQIKKKLLYLLRRS